MSTPSPFTILDKLTEVRAEGNNKHGQPQWSARCPIHDDSRNSLAVSIGSNGGVILMCHACGPSATGEILKAVGGTWSDLFPNDQYEAYQRNGINGHANGSSGRPKKTPSKHDAPAAEKKIVATYDYRDESGDLQFQVVRYEPKDFRQRRPTGNPAKPWEWNLHNARIIPYHLPQLIAADPSIPVLIVEGEKDVENLEKGKFVATCNPMGAGGAGKWLPSFNEHLASRHVVLIPDNDPDAKPGEPEAKAFIGQKHMAYIAAQLKGIAASIRILNLPNLPVKGDVTDWINAGGTPQQLKQLILDCPLLDDSTAPAAPAVLPVEANADPYRLANIFLDQSRDGRSSYITYRYWREVWYTWTGSAYRPVSGVEMKAMVSRSVKAEFDRINIEDQMAGRFDEHGNKKVALVVNTQLVTNVMAALAALAIIPTDADEPTWVEPEQQKHQPDASEFVSTKSHLLHLPSITSDNPTSLAQCRLHHTPAYFSTVVLPYDYSPSATCKRWDAFLDRNLEGDIERINVLQEFFGYCLSSHLSYQKFLLLEGEGSNGKSVICAVLTALLGKSNVSHVPLEKFGERFALTSTLGRLANIASEIGEIDRVAEGALKSFTAGDRMTFDRKNLSPVEAAATAKLVLATNNRPRFTDRSEGLWRRMLIIPLHVQIKDDEKIYGMDQQWFWDKAQEQSQEISGVFNWAIQGLAELLRNKKFTHSEVMEKAKNEYRDEVNPAAEFLKEHYEEVDPGLLQFTESSKVYEQYQKWCTANGGKAFNNRNFGKEVFRVFKSVKRVKRGTKTDRFWAYENMRSLEPIDDFSGTEISFDEPIQ